jgi:serine/threonine-protein kinase
MEFLRGETLKARLLRTGRFGQQLASTVALQMIAGMAHAHAAGIIHRDFKSENVMLVDTSESDALRVVIMDFGLARSSLRMFTQPITSSGHGALGTLDYMAPEQMEGKPATPQSDIYSLGLVLFETVTGRMAFEGDSPVARALRRSRSPASRPSKVVSEVDPVWDAPIVKCLAVDPRERFQRVDEIVPLLDATPSAGRRRTWIPAVLLVAALVGLLLVVRSASLGSPSTAASASAAPTRTVPEPAGKSLDEHTAPTSSSAPNPIVSAPAMSRATPPHRAAPLPPRRVSASAASTPDAGVQSKHQAPAADRLLDPFGH